jgi:outer membrane protein OmpA-like peptidoglycan-associated protein
MNTKKSLILATACVAGLAACQPTSDPYGTGYGAGGTQPNRTQAGAITGAMIGGFIGGTRKGDDKLAKAATGAIVGGLLGGAIGAQLDRQAAELDRDIQNDRVRIVNTGNELVVTMPEGILFATDSATVMGTLMNDLYAVADNLNRYPNTRVEVVGHTDNTGSASYNMDLSQRRAQSVAAVLRQGGVSPARIVAFGRGEDMPVASNLTPEGRAQNRRVELIIRPQ